MAVTINADTTNGLVITPDTSGDLSFQSSGSNIFTIDSSGNTVFSGALSWSGDLAVDTNTLYVDATNNRVGVGTTSPSTKLHVRNDGDALNVIGQIQNRNGGGNAGGVIAFINSTTDVSDNRYAYIGALTAGAGQTGNNLVFATNPTGGTPAERMRIDSSGNVGIGTTSPAQLLEVKKDQATSTRIKVTNKTNSGASTAGLLFENSTSDVATVQLWDAGTIGALTAYGLNMEGTGSGGANLVASNASGVIRFATGGTTERMRIDSSGRLFIGTTTNPVSNAVALINAVASSGDAFNLKHTVNGNNMFNLWQTGTSSYVALSFSKGDSQTVRGNIIVSTSSVSYNTTSDYRLKENVAPMSGGIDRLKQLKPSTWTWTQDGSHGEGFLAHEAQTVVPEAVHGTKDAMKTEEYEVTPAVLDDDGNVVTEAVMGTREVPDYQGIDQAKLVPLLTAALQEAITKIEDLETRIQALENA